MNTKYPAVVKFAYEPGSVQLSLVSVEAAVHSAKRPRIRVALAAALLACLPRALPAEEAPPIAAVPPMGWNSYDAFGDSVTEAEFLANAQIVHEKLQSHGWKYVVVDFRWYDPGADSGLLVTRLGAKLASDRFGRLLPAPNRFPSASGNAGFRALADAVHAMGLKFGIHVMRGIPRQAVALNAPIADSGFHAGDAAATGDTCHWCPDMYGVKGATEAGQAWYDSILRLYASWGVDLVKVDDLSRPYHQDEIHAVRTAIARCGRPMVFSTSPGETPAVKATDIATQANMWRISNDFWDRWADLNHALDLAHLWEGVGGPGHWPDADMLPLGHVALRCSDGGNDRWTRFTRDEQTTLLSLWAIAPSPLMLGGDLRDADPWTLALLTNDEVLAVDQDPLGLPARRVSSQDDQEVWIRDLADGSRALAVFNRSAVPRVIAFRWPDVGVAGKQSARDLWDHRDLGIVDGYMELSAPPHGSRLLRMRDNPGTRETQAAGSQTPRNWTAP